MNRSGPKPGTVLRGRKRIPQFKTLEDESRFWDTHSFLDYGNWEIVSAENVSREMRARQERKVPVTFRLEKDLVRKLKKAAKENGVKYQALAREILWRSLNKKAE